jgi:hypothetical protein
VLQLNRVQPASGNGCAFHCVCLDLHVRTLTGVAISFTALHGSGGALFLTQW